MVTFDSRGAVALRRDCREVRREKSILVGLALVLRVFS